MRRRVESHGSSVSLFPFLAVLICTMGVLITLLVVASKATEVRQRESNRALLREIAEQKDELNSNKEVSELKIDALLKARPQLQEALAQLRLRRSHIEDELRRLEQQFDDLSARAQALSGTEAERPISENDLATLRDKIIATEASLQQLLQQRGAQTPAYAIVAQPTINGTLRRPIYIECTARSITLQPTGTVIDAAELLPPILPGNPLDAALLLVREYWRKNQMAGEHGEPYPLLIVRPDGTQAYALARRAMQSWTDEFGYELIEQDRRIDFGSPDDQLAHLLAANLKTARAEYEALRNMAIHSREAQANANETNIEGLRAARDGGFEIVDESSGARMPSHHFSEFTKSQKNEQELAARPAASKPSDSKSDGAAGGGNLAASDLAQANPTNDQPNGPAGAVVPLAQSRGENWALPSYHASATPYRRSVLVRCDENSLRLDGGTSAKPVDIAWSGDERSVDQLVNSIWQIIQSWGIAERNGYWKPELRIVVAPGGQATFERVQILLQGSGFTVSRTEFR